MRVPVHALTFESVCVCLGGCGCTEAGVYLRACRLTNPACKAPSYYHLQPLYFHHIFRNFLINGTTFENKLLNIKCVFLFFLQLLFETFLILRRIQRDIVINVKTSNRYSFRILVKLEFSRQIFEKGSNIKRH
jgi:hypothetical protein